MRTHPDIGLLIKPVATCCNFYIFGCVSLEPKQHEGLQLSSINKLSFSQSNLFTLSVTLVDFCSTENSILEASVLSPSFSLTELSLNFSADLSNTSFNLLLGVRQISSSITKGLPLFFSELFSLVGVLWTLERASGPGDCTKKLRVR